MPEWQGVPELVRGLVGLVGFAALFLAARWRFTERGPDHGPADIGLD